MEMYDKEYRHPLYLWTISIEEGMRRFEILEARQAMTSPALFAPNHYADIRFHHSGGSTYWTEWCSLKFDSNIILTDELDFGTKRLLEVDKRLVVPLNMTLRFLITSSDVLHAWAVPELGIKMDAVPGRLNQIIAFVTKPGVYYGQCSELCGASHGFMPIVVVGMPYYDFVQWLSAVTHVPYYFQDDCWDTVTE